MKKILTLGLALGTATVMFAQGGYGARNQSRDVILGNGNQTIYRNTNSYPANSAMNARERDRAIRDISKDYERQIRDVERNRRMSRYERDRQVRMLEMERDRRIQEINYRYNNQYDSRRNGRW